MCLKVYGIPVVTVKVYERTSGWPWPFHITYNYPSPTPKSLSKIYPVIGISVSGSILHWIVN